MAGKNGSSPFTFFDDLMGDSSDEDARAREYMEKSLGEANGLEAPELGRVAYDPYSWQGDFKPQQLVKGHHVDAGEDIDWQHVDPRFAEAAQAGPSAMNGIKTDPRLHQQQMDTLNALKEIADGGGLTASDRANLSRIQNQEAQSDRGRRGAILQNMQQRGMGGSGMELLEQLQSSQAATDRQAQQDLDVEGQAHDRSLQAIMQSGQLAGSMRGQDFSEEAQRAQANDAIARFNAANSQQTNLANTGAANNFAMSNAENDYRARTGNRDVRIGSQRYNADADTGADRFNASAVNDAAFRSWDGRQQNSNHNTDVRNRATDYNTTRLPQQNFDNRRQVADTKGRAYTSASNYWDGQGARKDAARGAAWGAVGQIAGTAIGGPIGGAVGGAVAKSAAGGNEPKRVNRDPYENGYDDDEED